MAFDGLKIWFLTGSQDLYGEVILGKVKEQSAEIVAGLGAASDIPVEIVHKPTVTTPDGIRRACLDASSDDSCHRRHRLDAHLQPGQDVDRRPAGADQAVPAPAHAVRRRPALRPTSTWSS